MERLTATRSMMKESLMMRLQSCVATRPRVRSSVQSTSVPRVNAFSTGKTRKILNTFSFSCLDGFVMENLTVLMALMKARRGVVWRDLELMRVS